VPGGLSLLGTGNQAHASGLGIFCVHISIIIIQSLLDTVKVLANPGRI
jgi:hypothetical protein